MGGAPLHSAPKHIIGGTSDSLAGDEDYDSSAECKDERVHSGGRRGHTDSDDSGHASTSRSSSEVGGASPFQEAEQSSDGADSLDDHFPGWDAASIASWREDRVIGGSAGDDNIFSASSGALLPSQHRTQCLCSVRRLHLSALSEGEMQR